MFIHLPRLTRLVGLTASFFTASTVIAQAQTISLPENTIGIKPLRGQVTQVQQVRVPVDPSTTGSETIVTLQFNLSTCVDSLLPLLYRSQTQNNQVIFYVTALNAVGDASAVLCTPGPYQRTAEVRIPGIYQRNQIRVVFLTQGR